ncbi:MAG TPA: PIN domain-containing protein [Thermoplasmata archaeon]|nr:PIN domain-containing protein [Thermoplasmata archaeon]
MSGPIVVVDTSIVVGAKNPNEPEHADCTRVLELAHTNRFRPLLSAVSVSEVCVGYHAEQDQNGRQVFLDYVRSANVFELVPVDLHVAEEAARIRAVSGLRLPDAIIVATGVLGKAEFVVTHDLAFVKSSNLLPVTSAKELVTRLTR